MDRRRFLQGIGGTALALAASTSTFGRQQPSQTNEAVVGGAADRICKCLRDTAILQLSGPDAWQQAPAGLVRSDMSPKPAYEELRSLVKGKWWTKEETATGPGGSIEFRGFLGQYEVEARLGGRFSLAKDAGTLEIRLG
jgi:hypothetical protein